MRTFVKKTQEAPRHEIELVRRRTEEEVVLSRKIIAVEESSAPQKEPRYVKSTLAPAISSTTFGHPDNDLQQAKMLLAAQIIKVLDDKNLSTRQAAARTKIAHREFVCIRDINLSRVTIDRLVTILSQLGQEVELSVNVRPRTHRVTAAQVLRLL